MNNKLINIPMIILAGGFGTRLKSEISNLPKALAPINSRPFLFFLLDKWIQDGFTKFYFSLFYRSDDIIAAVESYVQKRTEKITVQFIVENIPMGTGGAVLEVLSKSDIYEDFLVVNADTWLSASFRPLASQEGNLIGILKLPKNDRYGLVKINKNRVVEFREKKVSNRAAYINTGVYKFVRASWSQFQFVPCSLENDLLPQLLKSASLGWSELTGDFIDIGVPEDYRKFVQKYGV